MKASPNGIDLRPLTQGQTTEMLERELGSQVLPNVAEILWEASEGNPLLLNGLIDDAKNDGTLLQRNGVWLLARPLNSHGDRLTDVVRRQLLRRSPEERQALNLIALAEPVSRELIESTVGEDPVAVLIEHELIRVTPAPHPQLRLWHSIYGDTLRNLISPARSLQLRQSLLRLMDSEPTSAEGLLRQVSWSMECGAEVEDRQLLRAAVLASRLYEDELARKAAALVKDPELQVAARSVTARTYFNTSDYAAARDILEADFAKGLSVAVLLTGTLMWAAVQAALGHSPADIMDRAGALLEAGERLATEQPGRRARESSRPRGSAMPPCTPWCSRWPASTRTVPARKPSVLAGPPANTLEAAFRLALESERLLVQGKAVQAFATVSEALESAGSGHDELYFLAEFLVARAAAAVIHGGDWEAAEDAPGWSSRRPRTQPHLVRRGSPRRARHHPAVPGQGRPGTEHPQRSPGVTAARGSPAALRPDLLDGLCRRRRRRGQGQGRGHSSPTTRPRHGRCHATCASSRKWQSPTARPGSATTRAPLTSSGRWAGPKATVPRRAWSSTRSPSALPWGTGTPRPGCLNCSPSWRAPGPPRSATMRLRSAPTWPQTIWKPPRAAKTPSCGVSRRLPTMRLRTATGRPATPCRERMAMSQRKRCLDRADSVAGQEQEAEADALGLLTRRERDIVALAVRGLSDRQIAAELQVSIRTVEGHLYRSYAKLNVKGRDQLPGVSSD